MIETLVEFIREYYQTKEYIPLHAPVFLGNEKNNVLDAIDSTYVSSVGAYVDEFERAISAYTCSESAVLTVNGTSALHIALLLAGVKTQDYVITQSLAFVATCNAISYCNAEPIFLDVDKHTLGLSPTAVGTWLEENAYIDDENCCRSKKNNRIIRACLPVHVFGHPVDLEGLLKICTKWNLSVIEDAAESLGSLYKGQHTGTFGAVGIFSFNGNKIITTGGGGVILSDIDTGKRARHLTTTAAYECVHDEIGYNYRMPNINAALGCAQLEYIDRFVEQKRALADQYRGFFKNSPLNLIYPLAFFLN